MGVWKRFGGVIERHGHKIALAVGRGLVKAIPVLGSVIDEVFKLGEMEDQRVPIRRIENDLERLLGGLDQRVLARIPNASIDDLGDGFARAIRDLPEEDRKAIVEAADALAAKQGGERLHRGAVLRERILRALARGDRFRHSLVSALHARKGEERFFEPGERINGRFLVVEMIGFGGMGTVYRVQDELVGDPRALKVIAPSLLANPDLRKRFIQEARVALALNHPNIVRAMHIDEARTTLDAPASLFILMELVSGASLRDFLKTRRRLGWEEARSLAGQILEGFAHAHAARVFHLDVKPENIMVDRAGRAKIIDFGLARAMGLDTAATPLAGMGTPYYMAPEQRDGGSRPDHRADLFSIAVVLYEMLTGSLPFGVVRRVEEVNPETPPGLHDVLLRSMAEHPEDRHPDAAAFKDALWLLGRSPETKARRRDGTPLVPAGGGVAPRPGAGAGAGAGPGAVPGSGGSGTMILAKMAAGAMPTDVLGTAPAGAPPSPGAAPTQPAVARTPEAPAGPGGARGVPPPAEVPLPAGLLVRPGAPLDPLSRLPREVFGAKDGARMVLVPTGKFLYGERLEEHYLRAFYLDAEPVTNARYERFVREARRTAPEHWPGGAPARGRERHPVVNLAWLDAFLFAQWAGMALPTEEQWEKGARGADGREFPWGREFSRFLANTKEAGLGDTAPVERFEGGKSVYGALDMAGNAWCWTGSWLDEKQLWRVIRGGSFSDERFGCRTHLRYWMDPAKRAPNVGFRCVREVT